MSSGSEVTDIFLCGYDRSIDK